MSTVTRNNKGQFVRGTIGYAPWTGKKRGKPSLEQRMKQSIALKGISKTKEHRLAISKAKRGKNNPSWKGGRRWSGGHLDSTGYWLIHMPDHPNRNINNYVPEHRLVMEKHIGRYLLRGEQVHHIDFNRKNNDISNLYVCSKSDHMKLHRKLDTLVGVLLEKGLIRFDREEGQYICN